MLKNLPANLVAYKRTAEYTNSSVPSGLLHAYNTKSEIWGKIVVLEGSLIYRILEPKLEEIQLSPKQEGIIEPTIKHEVVPASEVRFYVEFYRQAIA